MYVRVAFLLLNTILIKYYLKELHIENYTMTICHSQNEKNQTINSSDKIVL